jgi:hypothetical protein
MEEYVRKARLCIRYAHNRVYVKRSRQRLQTTAQTVSKDQEGDIEDMKIENVTVDDENFQEEYLEAEEIDE